MKKRLVKKWIKRYIKPYIQNLAETNCYATEITVGYRQIVVCQNQHVISNGFKKQEGEISKINADMRAAIIQTGKIVQDIVANYRYVLVRCEPIVRGKRIYMRLITE